jgi:Flp pilus assembly protein TadG
MSTKFKKPFWGTIKPGSNRGVAAIEFAIVLPLFLLISMGIIEFSVLLYDKAMITNASREGARAGILFRTPLSPPVDVEAVVNNYLQKNPLISLGGGGNSATVETARPVISGGKHIRVTVRYAYQFLIFPNVSGLFGGAITGPIQLVAESVMRMEDQAAT